MTSAVLFDKTMTHNLVLFVQRLMTAWNSHELEQVLPYYALEYEGTDIGYPEPQYGIEGIRNLLIGYWNAFPDLEFTLQGTIVESDSIALTWIAQGTHHGPILNIPPTGHRVRINGVSILQIRNGLVLRAQHIWDLAGMLRSLGLLPDFRI